MIVSDTHRFLFVHIPKCAGTAVRTALAPYDESGGTFDRRVAPHPVHGRLDYTHLPLHLMAEIAPDAFAKLQDYASFAVCRDPFARFPSALAQRIKMVHGTHIAAFDDAALSAEIERVMAWLDARTHVTDPDYIHFARQSDYVFLDGRRLVQTVTPVERIDALRVAIGARIGVELPSFGHANQRMVFTRPGLRGLLTAGSTAAKRLLPLGISGPLRAAARAVWLRPAGEETPSPFRSPVVRAFVERYYAEDIALYRGSIAAR
jgi:hypothetical protein